MNIRRRLIWSDQIEFVFHRRELRVSLIDANNFYKFEVMVTCHSGGEKQDVGPEHGISKSFSFSSIGSFLCLQRLSSVLQELDAPCLLTSWVVLSIKTSFNHHKLHTSSISLVICSSFSLIFQSSNKCNPIVKKTSHTGSNTSTHM